VEALCIRMLLHFSKGSVIACWLFHLYSTVKIQPFSPVFPLAESKAKAFCRLILWNFKEKASTIFYDTAFPKGEQDFLAVKRPCGQYGKRGYIFWM